MLFRSWVEEKMLSSVPVSLPLDELSGLLDLARAQGISFETLLANSLRAYIARHRSKSTAPHDLNEDAAPYNVTPPAHGAADIADAIERITTRVAAARDAGQLPAEQAKAPRGKQ